MNRTRYNDTKHNDDETNNDNNNNTELWRKKKNAHAQNPNKQLQQFLIYNETMKTLKTFLKSKIKIFLLMI